MEYLKIVRIPTSPQEECFHGIALYGIDAKFFGDQTIETFAQIIEISGVDINHLSLEFLESRKTKPVKVKSSKTIRSVLGKYNPSGFSYVVGDSLNLTVPNDLGGGVSLSTEGCFIDISFFGSLAEAHQRAKNLFIDLAYLKPKYGFLSHGPSELFVGCWNLGIMTNEMTKNEQQRAIDFGNERISQRYLQDMFYDLHDINLTSEGHLRRLIDGIPLADWINSNGLGDLKEVSGKLFIWSLTQNEIIRARPILLKNGAFIVSI